MSNNEKTQDDSLYHLSHFSKEWYSCYEMVQTRNDIYYLSSFSLTQMFEYKFNFF